MGGSVNNIIKFKTITSSKNLVIKNTIALKQKKARDYEKLFLIEGLRFVAEAFKAEALIDRIFVTEDFLVGPNSEVINRYISDMCQEPDIKNLNTKNLNIKNPDIQDSDIQDLDIQKSGIQKPGIYVVTDDIFMRMSDTQTPQGIIAVVKMQETDAADVMRKHDGFFLILESIQDPGNMGTIIRTGDAAGVSGIFLSRGCVDLYNPKVLRATMGSIFRVPCIKCDDITSIIGKLKENGIKVIAAHLKGAESYFNVDMRSGIAIIIGNEANGISENVSEKADLLVKIPIPGKAESLNASIAAALMMYEAVRQRSHGHQTQGFSD